MTMADQIVVIVKGSGAVVTSKDPRVRIIQTPEPPKK